MTKIKIKFYKCRTCFNATKGFQSLSKIASDGTKQKSYGEMLNEVANINFTSDKFTELPQFICGCCSRKLKVAHAFVQQVLEVNEKLWSTLQTEQNVNKKFDCLQESQIDIQTCLEIKVEHDEVENNKEDMLPKKDVVFKIEAEEVSLTATTYQLDKTNTTQNTATTERITLQDSIDFKMSNSDLKMSDSEDNVGNIQSQQYMDLSESVNEDDSYASDDLDWHDEDLEVSNKKSLTTKKIATLLKLKKPKGHHDPLKDEFIEYDKNITIDDEMLPARCDDCDKVFPNALLLNRHRRGTHVPDDLKIKCPFCQAKFSRRHNMYAHMRVMHKDQDLEKHQLKPKKLTKQHVCQECPRAYTNKYKLLAHVKKHHNPESVSVVTPEKLDKPKKRLLCTLCGLTFDNQSNLNIHYRRHTGEKPYKCDYCDRAYHRLYDAQVHRRSHTGEKPYQCTICEKAFRRSNKLTIHMRTHTNERPYKCTQCEKAFKQSKDLNIHKRTHTGERPYKCGVCQSTFTQSNSLRLHQTKQKHFNNPVQESNTAIVYQPTLSIVDENKII